MSTASPPALQQAIEEILREATDRLVDLLTRHQETWLAELEQQLAAADTTLRDRRAILSSVREATAASLSAGPATAGAPAAPPRATFSRAGPARPARVRTADVVEDLRTLLADHREGLRVGELRERTGYGNMQLHRALVQLEQAGEITRKGSHRKTLYRPTRRLPRPSEAAPDRRKKGKARPPKRSPDPTARSSGRTARQARTSSGSGPAQRTPTEDVKQAVIRTLRNRKKGLLMADLCALTGYTDKQLHRAIQALTEQGRIKKTGSPRHMRYILRPAR